MEERTRHFAVGARRGQHHSLSQLELQLLDDPRPEHDRIGPLVFEKRAARDVVCDVVEFRFEFRLHGLQQHRPGAGGRGYQSGDDDSWKHQADAVCCAHMVQDRVSIVDDHVACSGVPVALSVYDDVAARCEDRFSEHAVVSVIADSHADEHEAIRPGDGGGHDDRASAVSPQITPGESPDHHVLPEIVGAGSIRAACHAGHRPLMSAARTMTNTG